MDSDNKPSKIHPLTAAAAIALILVCLTGIAAMLGLLPNFSNKTAAPVVATNTVTPDAPTPAPVATPPAASAVAPTIAVAPPAEPTPPPKVVKKKPVKAPANTENQYQPSSASSCSNCGVVESVRAIEQEGPASGIGAGIGAVVGGLLGNQVGGGNGRTLATIAGAVGGGYAGNVIEKKRQTTTSYEVIVQMNSGERQRFQMNEQRWRSGDLVRVSNGNLIAR